MTASRTITMRRASDESSSGRSTTILGDLRMSSSLKTNCSNPLGLGREQSSATPRMARDAVHAAAEGREGPTAVSTKHFEEAMATARRSVTDADLAKYDAYAAKQKVSADAVDGEPAKAFSFDDDGDEAMFE